MTSALSSPPQVEARLAQALLDAYQQSFELLRAFDSSIPSADISRVAGDSIFQRVREVIAGAQRADNDRFSLQRRLPVEVWCDVWRHLSFSGLITATHVCSGWRTAALSCPTLWQDIEFYTSLHARDCCCIVCNDDPRGIESDPMGWKDSRYPKTSSNFVGADTLLSRSRDLKLSITLFVVPYRVDGGSLTQFSRQIADDHASRIRELTLLSADTVAPMAFLRWFPVIPLLESLSVEILPLEFREPDVGLRVNDFVPSYVMLPRLESLRCSSRFRVSREGPGRQFRFLRSLVFQPTDNVGNELRLALETCPNVLQLTLELGMLRPTRAQFKDVSWWLERFSRLRSVVVTGISPTPELAQRLRAIFSAKIPALSLEFELRRALPTGMDSGIFSHLESEILLTVAADHVGTDPSLSVLATDDNRIRRLSLQKRHAPSMEDLLAAALDGFGEIWHKVVSVTVDATLWPHLLSAFPVTEDGMKIKSLCIVMDAQALSCMRQGLDRHTSHEAQFPTLGSLTLMSGPQIVSMTPDDIHVFIRGLHLDLPLPALRIDHRLYVGDADQFGEIANSVTVGVVHAPTRM